MIAAILIVASVAQADADFELCVRFNDNSISIADVTFHTRQSVTAVLSETKQLLVQYPGQVPIPRLPYRRMRESQKPDSDPEGLYQQHLDSLVYLYLKYEVYQEFSRQFPPAKYGIQIDEIARAKHLALTAKLLAKQQELWFDGDRPILSDAEAISRMKRLYPDASADVVNAFVKDEIDSFSKGFVYRRFAWRVAPRLVGTVPAKWLEWQQVEPLFFAHLKAVARQPHPGIEELLAEKYGRARFFFVRHPTNLDDSDVRNFGDRMRDAPQAGTSKVLDSLNHHLRASRLKLQVGMIVEPRDFAALVLKVPDLPFQTVLRHQLDSVPVALYSPDTSAVYVPTGDGGAIQVRRTNAGHHVLVQPIVRRVLENAKVNALTRLPSEDELLRSTGLTGGSNELFGTTLPEWYSVESEPTATMMEIRN